MKKLKFLEDIYDGDVIIWRKYKIYEITFENDELYYAESEIKNESCGIEKKCEGKKFDLLIAAEE